MEKVRNWVATGRHSCKLEMKAKRTDAKTELKAEAITLEHPSKGNILYLAKEISDSFSQSLGATWIRNAKWAGVKALAREISQELRERNSYMALAWNVDERIHSKKLQPYVLEENCDIILRNWQGGYRNIGIELLRHIAYLEEEIIPELQKAVRKGKKALETNHQAYRNASIAHRQKIDELHISKPIQKTIDPKTNTLAAWSEIILGKDPTE